MIIHASRLHFKWELHIVFWFGFNADFARFTAALQASNAHCTLNCTFDADYTRLWPCVKRQSFIACARHLNADYTRFVASL